ncbi:hypothetical protein ELY21_08410 [Legionella sp. km535]|uniref:flagellar biosynthetic protein FliO n=1 Tax=Legionella sp. km535 TaxID=2498107 RepID=UPI000F8DE7A3|nr:flagellar biosynthetic protein FliO [Legionella sp. km535]RUR18241.1 hypothetical protein ELY21_08410 [Legionella sp. km535]
MQRVFLFLFIFWTHPISANPALNFKKELITNTHWSSYVVVLFVLIAVLITLVHYSKKSKSTSSQCKVIEQLSVFNKTKVFIIDYQGKQFLLADNQNALTILPLQDIE